MSENKYHQSRLKQNNTVTSSSTMGTMFGRIPNNGYNLCFNRDETPHPLKVPSNDPLDGFEDGREERPVLFTKEECQSAKIPLHDRDYCGYYLLKFRACRKDVWPFAVFCQHEKHAYLNCQYEDYILRMKEYERERRIIENATCTCFDDEDCDDDDDDDDDYDDAEEEEKVVAAEEEGEECDDDEP